MSELRYFFSTREDGVMNTNSAYYKEGMTKEEIRKEYTNNKIKFGIKEGFDGRRVLTQIQKNSNNNIAYPDGKSIKVTNELVEGYEDLYDLDLYADILTMDSNVKNVVLAYPVADCPVVFVHDNYKNAVGMAHCGVEFINRDLPGQIVDAMRENYDSKIIDLSVYIGPFIHSESYKYDMYPTWATNEYNWRNCIWKERNLYRIDIETAILRQLHDKGIDEYSIYASAFDTATNPKFYSNRASKKDPSKLGRFYEGCYFTDESVKSKRYVK